MIRSTDPNPRVAAEFPIDRWGQEERVTIQFLASGERIELALSVTDAKSLARTLTKAARALS